MSYIRTLAVVVLALVASPLAHATKQIMVVDCSKGASLAKAVMSADEHTTLSVFGTCTGAVSITTNGLTLDGNGSAIVTAPNANVITVNGAERVAINHITVAGGANGFKYASHEKDGVKARNSCSLSLWFRFAGSRRFTKSMDDLARAVSISITTFACALEVAASSPINVNIFWA